MALRLLQGQGTRTVEPRDSGMIVLAWFYAAFLAALTC